MDENQSKLNIDTTKSHLGNQRGFAFLSALCSLDLDFQHGGNDRGDLLLITTVPWEAAGSTVCFKRSAEATLTML